MRVLFRFTAVALVLTQLSCAAIFRGTTDTITVRSGEKGSVIYVNEMEQGQDQAVVQIPKDEVAKIRVSKPGCADRQAVVPTKFDPLSLLGILLDFGLISMLCVDYLATGAITRASQTNFIVTPACPNAISSAR